MLRKTYIAGFVILLALAGAAGANAQTFPQKTINVIVPTGPGGNGEVASRPTSMKAEQVLGQSIVVDFRAGGAGVPAAMAVLQTPADGYNLFVGSFGTHLTNPYMIKDLTYDPLKDFRPIVKLGVSTSVLVVPKDSPAHSVEELLELARTKPGGLTFGSSGVGVPSHLTGELIARAAGADMVHVPYPGAAPVVLDLVAGRLDFAALGLPVVLSQIESGALRALSLTTSTRLENFSHIPLASEVGFPEIVVDGWWGLFAPAGTPDEVIETLNAAYNEALNDPATRELMLAQSLAPAGGSAAEFEAELVESAAVIGKLLEQLGIEAE
ncbi:Bug family tripartite tricarboxylate transporter substrate binding protein [Pseudochelatococcus sp. B33]